jgi:xanthine dehydrogenase YagT iron-sulfur-binding subunit
MRSTPTPPNPDSTPGPLLDGISRRAFLTRVGAAGVAAGSQIYGATGAVAATATDAGSATMVADAPTVSTNTVRITLQVNGKRYPLQLDPRTTLLDCLREQIHLTGTKKGCDHGQCGACTVHVDGRRVNSCLTFAAALDGAAVTTIEGLGQGGGLHPMQTAFLEHDGYQCGYCTSGQIMSGVALLTEPCGPADADVKECMSGNICRCGAYSNIVSAIQQVRKAG